MAGPHYPNHPVSYIKPARPFYRFAATALGASMWFFVSYYGPRGIEEVADHTIAHVPSEKRRPRPARMEAPMGPLSRNNILNRRR